MRLAESRNTRDNPARKGISMIPVTTRYGAGNSLTTMVEEPTTIGDMLADERVEVGLGLPDLASCRILVNGQPAGLSTVLRDGDVVDVTKTVSVKG